MNHILPAAQCVAIAELRRREDEASHMTLEEICTELQVDGGSNWAVIVGPSEGEFGIQRQNLTLKGLQHAFAAIRFLESIQTSADESVLEDQAWKGGAV